MQSAYTLSDSAWYWWEDESIMKSRQFLIHADWNNLLCVSAENEDSAFIQSVKALEWDRVRVFFSTVTEIFDWWILQLNKHDNQFADIQQVHHAQQKQWE